jgi:hypothetical protein
VIEGEIGRLEELASSFLPVLRSTSLRLAPQRVSDIVDCTLELAAAR